MYERDIVFLSDSWDISILRISILSKTGTILYGQSINILEAVYGKRKTLGE